MNILGSKIYIFGGQVEGYFFNDLVAFDLNALQQATNRWEILIQNTINGGPPHGQIPPARTNHTIITWGDRLYLFGGTDGIRWYNDVWSYSPASNTWVELDCIGYIPSPREGHAAALVGDVMYIFGGRNEEGHDLGDLAAFRISSRRWYIFQNMGPRPSPRSGHSMTTVGKHIVVLAGEPSSAPRDPVELGMAYLLDTSKIRYPADPVSNGEERSSSQIARRPSGERAGSLTQAQRNGPMQRAELMERERSGSSGEGRIRSPDMGSRLPRAQGQLPAPTGPPPQAPGQRQPGPQPAARQPTRTADRAFSPSNENDRPQRFENMAAAGGVQGQQAQRGMPTSPQFEEVDQFPEPQSMTRPETYQPSQQQVEPYPAVSGQPGSRSASRQQNGFDGTPRPSVDSENLSKVQKISEEHERPQDSGLGSSPAFNQQHDSVAREMELLRQKNAWYASELMLAKKSGYSSRSADSPVFDDRVNEAFKDDDKPLVEALLKMRGELARVQETIDEQSKHAAERIAEIEKQRDTAINEAVFAKARLAGSGSPQMDGASDRSNDISRRLASSLEAQSELSRRIESLMQEIQGEKKTRELAEDTATAAQKRAMELDSYRQQNTSEIESLRSELHQAQKEAREALANHAEISTQHKMLAVDKAELSRKVDGMNEDGKDHSTILETLRAAVTASTEKADLLEKQLEEERTSRNGLEQNLRDLKIQHEQRSSELETASRELTNTKELAGKHAEEARTHREVVLAGFGKVSERDIGANTGHEERITILTQQAETANTMVRQNQAAADAASEKLRRAEERIAGLETYQEQASREGLSIRKQLQVAMKENQTLSSERAELEQKLERHMLETNALSVQHASLKDLLNERGISAAEKRRSRAADSPNLHRFSTPDLARVRELEQQLETHTKAKEEMQSQYNEMNGRSEQMKREYEEKLAALDNDHQAAVKYLRGTEKMLSKMKQEMQRAKNENGELKKKLDKAQEDMETSQRNVPADLTEQHTALQANVAEMQGHISKMQEQLRTTETELTQVKGSHATAQKDLSALQTTHTQSRTDLERLQKDNAALEIRAKDAENKVQLLLDQVESSVDNYRRQSRLRSPGGSTPVINGSVHQRERAPSVSASEASMTPSATSLTANHVKTHSRNVSNGGESMYSSTSGEEEGRNSMALDSLASELDALRSHWETTNRNYRLSGERFEFGGSGTPTAQSATAAGSAGAGGHSLASWRKGLELEDEDEHAGGSVEKGGAVHSSGEKDKSGEPTPTQTPTAERHPGN